MEQIKVLEQAISQQSGESQELMSQLDQVTVGHTSANHNSESMVGKIQVRAVIIILRLGSLFRLVSKKQSRKFVFFKKPLKLARF